jgi:hypothetical protein
VETGADTDSTDSDYGLIYASFSSGILAQRNSHGRGQLSHGRPAQEPGRGSLFRVVKFYTYRESASLARPSTLDCVTDH